jgi:basic membrane protein A and related proteins
VNRSIRLVAGLAAVALVTAACGSKSVTGGSGSTSSASGGGGGGASFKACMVTDTGGIDDRSFNQSAWAGMQAAQAAGKATVTYAQSTTENDYVSNINSFISAGCGIIVTVGFSMANATDAAAKAHPNQKFAIVDNASSGTNVRGIEYNTAQGAFLGGYLAAGMTKTGKVATWGGINLPTVDIYMDGFWEGVQYYNHQNGKSVQVLGWDETTQKGSFVNSFTDQNAGKQLTATQANQGADIVFPVAGNAGLGALAQAKASGGSLNAIWVDTDGFVSAPQYGSVLISSVEKGIAATVSATVEAAAAGTFSATAYVGTLTNNGTGLAPYHDFASKVPASLTSQLDTIKSEIISGQIKITSKNQPSS